MCIKDMKIPSSPGGASSSSSSSSSSSQMDPTIQQVSKRLSQSLSPLSTSQKPEKQLGNQSSSSSWCTMTIQSSLIRTLLGWSVCGISFWLLRGGDATVKVSFLPESIQELLSLSQQHPQQTVLLLLAGHLSMDLLLALNPMDNFHTTEISTDIIEDILTFMIVVGTMLFFTMDSTTTNNFGGSWENPIYINVVLYALIVKVAVKELRGGYTTTTTADKQQTSNDSTNVASTKSTVPPILASSKSHTSDATSKPNDTKEAKDPMAWLIHGREYDLSDFVDRHPGGKESILLGRGRDCTAMFESYHAFTNQHRVVLEKYRKQQHTAVEEEFKEDIFYNVLRERATAVLLEKGVDPYSHRGATPLRVLYYLIVIMSVAVTGYYHIMGSIMGSFLFAIAGWLLGSLGHDAGHFAVSRIAWINEWGVWGMSLICNPVVWQHQHTYSHHSYTNELDHDPDLHHFTWFLRVHKMVQYDEKYRYQSNWLVIMTAYLFTVFGECFWLPFNMLDSGEMYSGALKVQDKDRPDKAIAYRFHFATYIFMIMVIPLFTNSSIWKGIIAVIVHIATLGVTFALFSQINHLTEDSVEAGMKNRGPNGAAAIETNATSPPTEADMKEDAIIDSWAAAQIETSNNFAPDSWLWHVLSNGLNHQIEHHLFPGLNHCHLHHIAPVVRKTCEEYKVNYTCYANWASLWEATLAWYNKLSIDDMMTTTTSTVG